MFYNQRIILVALVLEHIVLLKDVELLVWDTLISLHGVIKTMIAVWTIWTEMWVCIEDFWVNEETQLIFKCY